MQRPCRVTPPGKRLLNPFFSRYLHITLANSWSATRGGIVPQIQTNSSRQRPGIKEERRCGAVRVGRFLFPFINENWWGEESSPRIARRRRPIRPVGHSYAASCAARGSCIRKPIRSERPQQRHVGWAMHVPRWLCVWSRGQRRLLRQLSVCFWPERAMPQERRSVVVRQSYLPQL